MPMRHNAYQTLVPVSHEKNIYLPTGGHWWDSLTKPKKEKNTATNPPQESTSHEENKSPTENIFKYDSMWKVLLALAVVFGIGLGVPIFIADSAEKCCRGGDERVSLLHYCKNTDPMDMWQQKSGRNCDYYEKYPQACDADSKDILLNTKCFDEVRWIDDVDSESCAQKRDHFVYYPEEEEAWCATAFGTADRASRKDENGKWVYIPSNMTAKVACCFCGHKSKSPNFEAIHTPKKHCCGCRIHVKEVGEVGGEEEYEDKVSAEGGSCDPSTDKKVQDLETGELVSRNKICKHDPKLALAWIVAIVWWGGILRFAYKKYKTKTKKEDASENETLPKQSQSASDDR